MGGKPVDGDGLVNPDGFPCRWDTMNPIAVGAAGISLRKMGEKVASGVTEINGTWNGLPAVYQSPEQGQVYGLMSVATAPAEEINAAFKGAGDALDAYSAALAEVRPELKALDEEARRFREEALQGYDEWVKNPEYSRYLSLRQSEVEANPNIGKEYIQIKTGWERHQHAVDKNNELVGRYDAVYVKITQAVSECAAALNKLATPGQCMPSPPAPSLEELKQSPTPWGGTVERQSKNCTDSVGTGINRWADNTWQGFKPIIGFDDNGWSIGNIPGGIANAAVGATDVIVSTVMMVYIIPKGLISGVNTLNTWELERV